MKLGVAFLLFTANLVFAENKREILDLAAKIEKAQNFVFKHYDEIKFDGLLGVVIGEAQILDALRYYEMGIFLKKILEILIDNFRTIRSIITPLLPNHPKKMITFKNYLLDPNNWSSGKEFVDNSLEDLGIFSNWTKDTIIEDRSAIYKGVPSDFCLLEILNHNCEISQFCNEMMLAPRLDSGYFLTHRLLYLQVMRLKKCCKFDQKTFTRKFCSWILREAKTNSHLNFPQHDIFLEQIVLCGIEGFSEFLTNQRWLENIIEWQTDFGCYRNSDLVNTKRTAYVISYGCTDHSTGLGIAALALNLKFKLFKLQETVENRV